MRKKIKFHLTVVYLLAGLAVIAAAFPIFFGDMMRIRDKSVGTLNATSEDIPIESIELKKGKPAPLPEDIEATELEFANDGGIPPEDIPVVLSEVILTKNTYSLKSGVRTEYSIPAEKIDSVVSSGKTPEIRAEGIDCNGRPVVAILLARSGKYRGGYGIDEAYITPILNNGLCPVFISYDYVNEQLNAAKPSGVLLPGGAFAKLHKDTVTQHEGDAPHEQLKRNFAYLITIDYSAAHNLPLLGICAGHQQLSDYLGGKLIGNVNKKNKGSVKHLDVSGRMHKVSIEEDTLLRKILGKKSIRTNSMHRSAVSSGIKGNFIVSARASDGVIEAIEPKDPWSDFVLGVQWHPERMYQKGIFDGGINLMNSFCESVNRRFNN